MTPAALGESIQAVQTIRIEYGPDATQRQLDVAVSVTPDYIRLIGLSTIGMRLFTLNHNGLEATVESSVPLPDQLKPELVMADMQRVYWPNTALRNALVGSCWQLEEPAPGQREYSCDGKPVVSVTTDPDAPWQRPAQLIHHEHGYRLTITKRGESGLSDAPPTTRAPGKRYGPRRR